MADRVDILGDSGTTYDLTFKGKKYKMSRLTGKLKAKFELHLRTKWLRTLSEMRPYISDEDYRKEMADFKAKAIDSFFTLEGPHAEQELNTQEGSMLLLRLCLDKYQPDLDDDEFFDLLFTKHDELELGFSALHPDLIEAGRKAKEANQGNLQGEK